MDSIPQTSLTVDGSSSAMATAAPRAAAVRACVRSFVLHVLTGVLAVAGHYAVMWALLSLGAHTLLSSAGGFMVGAAIRYLLSYFHVFSPSDGIPATFVRFLAALGIQLAANVVILDALLQIWTNVWMAQVATTVLMTFVNYLMYRLWVFR